MQLHTESAAWQEVAKAVADRDPDHLTAIINATDDWMEMEPEKAARREGLEAIQELLFELEVTS